VWTGLVFAGGKSERMGRDKALVPIAGRTLLERAVATIREAGGAPLILGESRESAGLVGVRFADETAEGGERLGPLFALRHGLRACGTRVVVALACDLPLVPPGLLSFLASGAGSRGAVVPRARGELQVLSAAYNSSCLDAIERRLTSGRLSVHGFLGEVDVRIVEGEELRPFGGEDIFLNINTPADLAAAERILASRTA
jgi:molybdopterin-guanine dinucleotide biosynthesis protein A